MDRTASLVIPTPSVVVFFAIVVSMLCLQLVREVSVDIWEILAYDDDTNAALSGRIPTPGQTSITDSSNYIQLTED